MKFPLLLVGMIFAFMTYLAPAEAQEQTQTDGTLHVMRPFIHAEQEEAELCLEFDRDLEAADHRRTAASVRLESGGKNLQVAAHNISITGSLLCLSTLEHRREYRLVINGLRGAKGEKLATAYSLTFTVPDRQPSLAFVGDTYAGGLMRWQDNDPLLRAVNVPHVHLELIRITDPASMSEAWRSRRQTTLAPSESAAFAHDHGEVVWSGDLDLDGSPNKAIEQKISLRDAATNLPFGLYLIVARAPEPKTETKTDADTGSLAATGALWLFRSGLRLHAVRDAKGFYALAEKFDESSMIKDVHLVVEDAGGQKLAEATTGADGVAFLSLAADRQGAAAVLSARMDSGDLGFADLTVAKTNRFILPGNEISLVPDKASYSPGAVASIMLAAHDAEGHSVTESGTSLQLQWPDGSPYMSFPVAPEAGGATHLSFPIPATNGLWSLVWQAQDGGALAQAPLRVTSNPDAPHIEASTDHALISIDGETNLTLKSLTREGKPAPWLVGRVFVAWMVPDHIFQEWKDYRFGNDKHPVGETTPVASFMTDGKGIALLHLSLAPPDDKASLHSAILSVRSGAAEGAADPASLTLPMKPKDSIVGIKPLAPGGRFPENSLARFSVVTIDTDGHRQPSSDLTYQVYEGGRSFDWYQAEGRWNYKPLQQNRRIGGGALESGADGESIIEWPVAAGNYRLEITDANGAVRAATEFSAGWGLPELSSSPSPLGLTPSTPSLRSGQETRIHFTLDQPSMVSVFIGDDHIRKIIHQPMPKGENSVSFTPEKDWGSRIGLRVEADNLNLAGQLTLALLHEGQVAAPAASKETGTQEVFSVDARIPPAIKAGDLARSTLDLKNNGKTTASYHMSVMASPDLKITGLAGGSISLASNQSKTMPFTLTALRSGTATLKIDITGPPRFHLSHEWSIPVLSDEPSLSLSAQQKIEPQQSWPGPIAEKSRAKSEVGTLFLSSTPLFNAPAVLADILQVHPFTTGEIAEVMETLRLWHDIILASGLLPETALEVQRQDLLLRLMARQNSDGGFPPAPDDPADFTSTTAALVALAHTDKPVAKPATDLAASWLRHHLENTWFDEHERPLRAAAYAALAEADRLDSASLHYFGDTSADKSLPPLAAVQLALAFAKSSDQDKASFWLDASGTRKNPDDIASSLLPVLAANPLFDPQSMMLAVEKTADSVTKGTSRKIESLSGLLRTVWFLQHRKGAWRVTVNTDKRNPKDVLVLSLLEKTAALTIHNTGDGPIFLVRGQEKSLAPSGGSIARHVYQLGGTEMGVRVPFEKDRTYLVILEGPWVGDAPMLIHDNPVSALRPAGCLPPAPLEADDELAWLKSQPLSPLSKCEIWGGGVDMLVTPKQGNATSWRIAYLAKAEWAGTFDLAPASARNSDEGQNAMRGEKTRIDVR